MFKIVKSQTLKNINDDVEYLQIDLQKLIGERLQDFRRIERLEAELLHAENSARIAQELLRERDQNA